MNQEIEKRREYRKKMNNLILDKSNKNIKRFFALDNRSYESGVLTKKFKELLGLVGSIVLRCDDCIFYHLDQCNKEKVSDEELNEALNIALIVGGSITIPHIRRAYELWEKLIQ